ncbi:hypothetical protein LEP1GSC050_1689 [Leptospira broomii serovar Hurstbridge str. 5399]|uniref:Uncharacterized protein n=1 Tax=Leptospira broomii serovar Hurstbridge str. 5399 TaxID=1049789 RepID=T0EXC5_9LEPT|nr:hypothetical protein LEP1GSC050_1689 [Leptospira broomii serovar Hurstbridge str. 5399]
MTASHYLSEGITERYSTFRIDSTAPIGTGIKRCPIRSNRTYFPFLFTIRFLYSEGVKPVSRLKTSLNVDLERKPDE